jgi:hypothetical protein
MRVRLLPPQPPPEKHMITQFQVKVQEALRAGRQRELAAEFEVAESTIWRWSEGTAKPMAGVQAWVLKFLQENRE